MVAKINSPQGAADAYKDWPIEVQLLAVIAGSELPEDVVRTERRIRANDRWLGLAHLHKPDGFEARAELPGLIDTFALTLEKAHGVIGGQARWGNLGILKTHAVLYFEMTGVVPDIAVLRSLWLARQHRPPMDHAPVESSKPSGLTPEQEAANAANPSAAFELAAGNAYESAMQKWARGEQGAEAPPPGGSTEGD